jgi:integrase
MADPVLRPPPDANGNHKRITETVKGLKSEAEKVLRERLAAIEKGGYIAKDKETVAEYFIRWLETYAATNTTLRTQQGYRQYINGYAVPSIGSVELQKVSPQQIQDIYSGVLERGLSNTTVSQLHRILHKAFGTAVKWGLLIRNPVDATTASRLERKQLDMWDIETIHRFLKAARESRFADLYTLAVLTGMRRSELCGLKWENVDLIAGRASVVNTLQRLTGYGLVEGQPKTARSRRSISLSP